MDSKDSAEAVAVAPPPDDGGGRRSGAGLNPDDKELGDKALALFNSRQYADCVKVLDQLLKKKEGDLKVHHNMALAEFLGDASSDPKKLLDTLAEIKKKIKDVASNSGEQMEVAAGQVNNAGSGSKEATTISQQIPTGTTGSVDYVDVFGTSAVVFNQAVIHYQLHEYKDAFFLLEPLAQNLEPLDEMTTIHVCLLLLDITLILQDASKAAGIIQYLEKFCGVDRVTNQGENGSSAHNESSSQGSKTSGGTAGVAALNMSSSDSGDTVSGNNLDRTLSDETLEYENLISTLDSSGPNINRPMPDDIAKAAVDHDALLEYLKLHLPLYKVRLLLLTKSWQAAKRELKLAMNNSRGGDLSAALLLKANLEYARGNHRKSIKLLNTFINRTEPAVVSMLYNNLGCIYFQLKQYHLSTFSVCKALRSSSWLLSEKPCRLSTFANNKCNAVLYNLGLHYLTCEKPLVAARCFYKTVPVFYTRPLLWVRLAECCLLAQDKGLLRLNVDSSSGEDAKIWVLGSGRYRWLASEDVKSKNRYLDSVGEDGILGPDKVCRLSLPYARQCLVNALHLLKCSESSSLLDEGSVDKLSISDASDNELKASTMSTATVLAKRNRIKEKKDAANSSSPLDNILSTFEDMQRRECRILKQVILTNLAYVELSLENPLKALSYVKELRQLPDCSKLYLFFSLTYAAEALCNLGRLKEAAELISTYVTDGDNAVLPYSDEDREIWRIVKTGDGKETNNSLQVSSPISLKPEEARGLVLANLATTSALEGSYDQASQFLSKALSCSPNNPSIILAAIHLDLRLGKTEDAVRRLKQCSCIRFYPTGVTSNNS